MMLTRFCVWLLAAVLLTGCKIRITVPEGGRVESASGAYTCESGDTCTIDVVDVFFDEVFQAKPAPGYKFTTWRQRESAFCGGKNTACPLATTEFPGTALMQILESEDVFFLDPVFGKPNTWTKKADTSTAGVGAAACAIRGKLYAVALGWGREGNRQLGTVEEYDPVTDTWTPRASMPTPRNWLTASAVGNKCYVIGGGETGGPHRPPAMTTVEEYDPETDSWRTRAPLPVACNAAGSAVVEGKIYVIGGSPEVYWDTTPTAAVAIYDPATNQWSTGADMPTPRQGLGVAAVDGLIYAVGGANYDLGLESSDIVERYDPKKDEWTSLTNMPGKRNWLTAAALNGKLYAIGGLIDAGDNTTSSVMRYDPKADKWDVRADMSTPRYGAPSAVLNGQILVVGGRELRESLSLYLTEEHTP